MASYERRLVREVGEHERKHRELELMTKAKEQKERHMAVLVREKEKALRQMDLLTQTSQRPSTAAAKAKPSGSSLMSSMSSFHKENLAPNSENPAELKKELILARKEAKKLQEACAERDKELERLRRENYNLAARCRNKL